MKYIEPIRTRLSYRLLFGLILSSRWIKMIGKISVGRRRKVEGEGEEQSRWSVCVGGGVQIPIVFKAVFFPHRGTTELKGKTGSVTTAAEGPAQKGEGVLSFIQGSFF
jgi:hypothetical protein